MRLVSTSRQTWQQNSDWILDNDLHILNNGSATRTSQITGNDSTPDISLCGSNWSAKTSWRLVEPIGSSNHLPIIIELNHKICYKPVILRSARWHRNGIDLSSFTKSSQKCTISLVNITYIFEFLTSMTSSLCHNYSCWKIKTQQEI